ncbi:putative membrane protein (TIGR02226 family) [Tenacibaculum adriaticum]|uniref:Putative membrane protein (TIGR02226 family) n=1 Tax=Tenacibaculum adriaticum TaxID=413713 RepID=A0A5S5DLM1_9FLAO|nr:BatA domain-containing protein [Tenacibaculum adriaticum]TYP96741.1 putative membrane protein (TIGR02226 family) [Tenacibaculum adriaticum]
MQFKHPEFLYFFALLIIPVLVHLFQLQRFVKVPFTNVAFLKKLVLETRKSSRIKKWLILATRLLLLSAIILAFSQPYLSNNSLEEKQHTFIYLDNSLSTNAKGEKGNLLQIASQELIESISDNSNFSLLSNTSFHQNISSSELKNILLKTENEAVKAPFSEILLKIYNQNKILNTTLSKNILISDFQNAYDNDFTNVNHSLSLIQLQPEQKNNLSIDSVFVNENTSSNFNVNVVIKNQGDSKENIPIAIFNNQKLISKQTFSIEKDNNKTVSFSIQKTTVFLGKLEITYSDTFSFDNSFYFTLNSQEKTNVLAIGNTNDFLSKIYTKDEFNFTNSNLQNTNYNSIEQQQLIILNELEKIPQSLISTLTDFSKKGGQLVVIPNPKSDINSYNLFLKNVSAGKILPLKKDTLKITNINFKHPLFKNVFDKKVSNFQYPTTQSYYPTSFTNSSNLISFENNEKFIKQVNLPNSKLFWIASSLNKLNSNFTNSPLVVPVFYNIGQQSLQLSKLYYTVDELNTIEVKSQLGKDDILSIQNSETSFIPLQQNNQNKITLTTKEQPFKNGFYHILHQKDTLKTIAFNYPKEESSLQYLDIKLLVNKNKNIEISSSVKETLQEINKKNKVRWLWKLFLSLAIVSLLLEILILKYFKV